MLQPGRSYTASNTYRYGFNGKENDNEVKGAANEIDYGMRIYDPRIGRFLSIDPLGGKYAGLTPYQYASNNPIAFIDIDGEDGKLPKVIGHTWPKIQYLTDEQIADNINSVNVNGIPKSYLEDLLASERLTLSIYDVDQNDRTTANSHGGNATIGIGHLIHLGAIGSNQYDNEALTKEAPFTSGITIDQAFSIFGNDVQIRVNAVNRHLKTNKLKNVDENSKAVFVDLLYNAPKSEPVAIDIYKKAYREGGNFWGDVKLYNAINTNVIHSISDDRKKSRLKSIEKAMGKDFKRSNFSDDPRENKAPENNKEHNA